MNHNYHQKKLSDNLSKEDISDEAYRHACNVWESFHCTSLLDYQNIYMNLDVCYLADVFEGPGINVYYNTDLILLTPTLHHLYLGQLAY